MAKLKGKNVVLAGIVAGAASYLSKKENRDKLMEYINQVRTKVNDSGGLQGLSGKMQNTVNISGNNVMPDSGGTTSSSGEFTSTFNKENENKKYAPQDKSMEDKIETIAQTADTSNTTELEGNHFVEEGYAQTLIQTFNDMQDDSRK